MSAGPLGDPRGLEVAYREMRAQQDKYAQQAAWLQQANQLNARNWGAGLGNIYGGQPAYQQVQQQGGYAPSSHPFLNPPPVMSTPSKRTGPAEYRWLRGRVHEVMWYPRAEAA